jgi:WD40 repeat protein
MKRHILMSLLIASTILGSWFPFGAKAAEESKETKSSKSELKLLYELTLPECITAYSVKKGKDRKNEIDKILTITGVYEIDDKKQTKLIKKRTQELPEKTRCYPSSESFSPDGQYVVFCDELEERSKTFVIYDFKNNSSSQINAGLFGAFSNQSVMFHTDMYQTLITNFSGMKLAELPGMSDIKGHAHGFICDGMDSNMYYLNSDGRILAQKPISTAGLVYDVDQKTGITAILIPPESKLLVTDYAGNLKGEFKVPNIGHPSGIGLSLGGDYIVVISENGWIKFFDINRKKEIWKKDFVWGGRFVSSSSPVPVSTDGEYVIIYGDLDRKENPAWSLIILDQFGKNVALFDAPRDRGYIAYYYIDFIPGTNKIVGFTDNTLSVHEIVERD